MPEKRTRNAWFLSVRRQSIVRNLSSFVEPSIVKLSRGRKYSVSASRCAPERLSIFTRSGSSVALRDPLKHTPTYNVDGCKCVNKKNDNNLHRRVIVLCTCLCSFSNKPPQQKKRTQHVSKLLHKRTSIYPSSRTRIVRRFTTSTRIKDRPRISRGSSILDAPSNVWKFDKYTVFAIDISAINDQAQCAPGDLVRTCTCY